MEVTGWSYPEGAGNTLTDGKWPMSGIEMTETTRNALIM